ncbi:hypothetical protein C8R45DRAFT_1091757 [Mycena sanguinolenta]|nr:hypothetical protein C8R45DRAFT_1091757 [Mycena sanguinolenta]
MSSIPRPLSTIRRRPCHCAHPRRMTDVARASRVTHRFPAVVVATGWISGSQRSMRSSTAATPHELATQRTAQLIHSALYSLHTPFRGLLRRLQPLPFVLALPAYHPSFPSHSSAHRSLRSYLSNLAAAHFHCTIVAITVYSDLADGTPRHLILKPSVPRHQRLDGCSYLVYFLLRAARAAHTNGSGSSRGVYRSAIVLDLLPSLLSTFLAALGLGWVEGPHRGRKEEKEEEERRRGGYIPTHGVFKPGTLLPVLTTRCARSYRLLPTPHALDTVDESSPPFQDRSSSPFISAQHMSFISPAAIVPPVDLQCHLHLHRESKRPFQALGPSESMHARRTPTAASFPSSSRPPPHPPPRKIQAWRC